MKTYLLIVAISLLAIISCHRVKRKADKLIDNTKEKISNKADNLEDKVFSHFDSFTPDTKWNKIRFKEFFSFEPTTDVKNIYCYNDEMGFDCLYAFSFNCDTSTLNRIVSNLGLTRLKEPDNVSEYLQPNFNWWNKEEVKKITPYFKKGSHETYWYLWFEAINRKVYYLTFDM